MFVGGEANEYVSEYISLLRPSPSLKSNFSRQKLSGAGFFGMLYLLWNLFELCTNAYDMNAF
jgi:hypothetical protein